MSEVIGISIGIQVVSGPSISESVTKTVDAYDKVDVLVEAAASDYEVEIQPGGSGQVSFLIIRLTSATAYSTDITYKVNADTGDAIVLDGPHMFIGAGGVALLDVAPTKLFFSNGGATDVTVQVLVGRDATP